MKCLIVADEFAARKLLQVYLSDYADCFIAVNGRVPKKTILAEIDFIGARNGSIQIIAGLDFGRILAENIGNLTEPDREAACDALKELSNVTCGLFLPVLTSTTADPFAVTVPRLQTYDNSSQLHLKRKSES